MSSPIQLPLIDHIRLRPGFYIGGSDQRALNNCVLELLASSLEEHLAGRGNVISVTLHCDGSLSVQDEGAGISVALHPQSQRPFIEWALTTLHVWDTDLKRPYHVLGAKGVGVTCVNAVSEWMRVRTVSEGAAHEIGFACGQLREPLKKLPPPVPPAGKIIRFKPDPEIFMAVHFDRNFLTSRLDHLAVLHPKLAFSLVDERPNLTNRPLVSLFHYPGGIADFLKLASLPEPLWQSESVTLNHDVDGMKIALGFRFSETGNTNLFSFANSSPTLRGGTHVQGFLRGLADAFNELVRPKRMFQPAEMRHGLNAVIGVWLPDPKYGGSTKDELINPEIEELVYARTLESLQKWSASTDFRARWLTDWLDEVRETNPV